MVDNPNLWITLQLRVSDGADLAVVAQDIVKAAHDRASVESVEADVDTSQTLRRLGR